MSRTRRSFERREPVRDSTLLVIATEGAETEPRYFRTLSGPDHFRSSRVRVLVISAEDNLSAPDHVLERLRQYADNIGLTEDDHAFLVLDYDRWGSPKLAAIARAGGQRGFELIVSNPCFELWFLLHVANPESWTEDYLRRLAANERTGRHRRFIEDELRRLIPAFGKKNVTDPRFYDRTSVGEAIKRAVSLDTNPGERWCEQLCTRVYRVVERILAYSEQP